METMVHFSAQKNVAQPALTKRYIHDGVGFIELLECFGSDLTVANAARVSMNKESSFEQAADGSMHLAARDKDLIFYLAQHKHITPFFHPQVRFRIKMPICVVREWYRHTVGFARNEVSRRYISTPPECFVPAVLRQRDKSIKQGSKDEAIANNTVAVDGMRAYVQQACDYYNQLLEQGICPEQARMILPQSMYTEFIETASLAGYGRLAVLRCDAAAQREIQEYANLISSIMQELFPVAWRALMEAGKGMLL